MKLKTFEKIVKHLWSCWPWPNADAFAPSYKWFDFPDYGSLDKRISNHLSPDAVDAIQDTVHRPKKSYKNMREFKSKLRKRMIELGVEIKSEPRKK